MSRVASGILFSNGGVIMMHTWVRKLTVLCLTVSASLLLGLAVVQGIIREHGGRIRIESQEGQGTTVTLTLPVAV